MSRTVVERFTRLPQPSPAATQSLASLWAQEHEVLLLLVAGLSNREIGGSTTLARSRVLT